jgi:riboflavin kinase/FMN adenylyltransferase
MHVLTDMASFRTKRKPIALAAGFFDGVHRGHRKVLQRTMAKARSRRGHAWVLTFDAHPLKTLRPDSAPRLLTSNKHKLRLLSRLDLHGCLLLPFTRDLAGLSPGDFLDRLLNHMPTLAEIVVGRNWRFGRNRSGTTAQLSRLAGQRGLSVTVVAPATAGGEAVSSTRIRSLIMAGTIDGAARMLGRRVSILGTVTRGSTLGRTLGYPTANLEPHNEVLPPFGVYAVLAALGSRTSRAQGLRPGILNYGVRPTFGTAGKRSPVIELHLFDMDRELYGRDIEVFFVRKIREERRFPSADALTRQIADDIAAARRLCRPRPSG